MLQLICAVHFEKEGYCKIVNCNNSLIKTSLFYSVIEDKDAFSLYLSILNVFIIFMIYSLSTTVFRHQLWKSDI